MLICQFRDVIYRFRLVIYHTNLFDIYVQQDWRDWNKVHISFFDYISTTFVRYISSSICHTCVYILVCVFTDFKRFSLSIPVVQELANRWLCHAVFCILPEPNPNFSSFFQIFVFGSRDWDILIYTNLNGNFILFVGEKVIMKFWHIQIFLGFFLIRFRCMISIYTYVMDIYSIIRDHSKWYNNRTTNIGLAHSWHVNIFCFIYNMLPFLKIYSILNFMYYK